MQRSTHCASGSVEIFSLRSFYRRACRCSARAMSGRGRRTETTTPIARITKSSWLPWEHNDEQKQLCAFAKKLIQLRRDHPVFRRPKFFQGRRIRGSEIRDVMWFNPGGNEMSDEEWASPFLRCHRRAPERRHDRCAEFRGRADPRRHFSAADQRSFRVDPIRAARSRSISDGS